MTKKNQAEIKATDWTAALPCLDVAGLQPISTRCRGSKRMRGGSLARPAGTSPVRPGRSWKMLASAKCNPRYRGLPQPGTVVHLLTAKRFALFNVIEAVLTMRAPATIRYLAICTLGFSVANVETFA